MPSVHEESLDLRDGTRIHIREVQPSDRPLFDEGIKRLSPESWLFRFLMPRDHLENEELDYLVHPDGVTHYALGAVTRDASGREGPVAVARFVRLPDSPKVAECAIVVLDAFQERGVGRRMGERLMRAAGERGVALFRCEILLENVRMKHLIEHLAPWAEGHVTGSLLTYWIPLDAETRVEDVLGPSSDQAALARSPAAPRGKKPKKQAPPSPAEDPVDGKPMPRSRLFGLRGRRKPSKKEADDHP